MSFFSSTFSQNAVYFKIKGVICLPSPGTYRPNITTLHVWALVVPLMFPESTSNGKSGGLRNISSQSKAMNNVKDTLPQS